jgi:predicted Zn-dependent protease
LAASPDNPLVADTVGWLQVKAGNPAQALPLLARAAAAMPQQLDVQYHWAVALADTGDSSQAMGILDRLTADKGEFAARADAERRLSDLRKRAK